MNKFLSTLKTKLSWDNFMLLPIIFFICIIPMLMGVKEVRLSELVNYFWITDNINYSLFSYVKYIAIVINTLITLIILTISILKKKITFKFNVFIILALLYGLFIIISTQTSQYKNLAYFGAPDRYEGMYVLLSYMVMFIYTLTIINNFKKFKIVLYAFIFSIGIMTFFGALEFFGFHLVEIEFIRKMLNLPIYAANNLGAQKTTSLSLYSINYVGQYLALVIPLILFAYFAVKKPIFKMLFIAISYFALMCIFGSYSYASFIAIILSLVIFLLLYRKVVISQYKGTIILIVSLVLLYFITNAFTSGLVSQRADILSPSYEGDKREVAQSRILLNNIDIIKNNAFIDTDSEDFNIIYKDKQFYFTDTKDLELQTIYNSETKKTYFANGTYSDFSFDIDNNRGIIGVFFAGKEFYLEEYVDTLKVYAFKGYLLDVVDIPKTKFQFPPTLFSGRGIIYNGLLPSTKEHLLFGNGADTTILSYPQNDIIGKINVFSRPNILISKPHSLYLQILHDLGLFALLTFILLISLYAIKSIILYVKCDMDQKHMIGISLSVSIFAYLVASFCYDSTVHISPIFWTLLALGIIINKLIEEQG